MNIIKTFLYLRGLFYVFKIYLKTTKYLDVPNATNEGLITEIRNICATEGLRVDTIVIMDSICTIKVRDNYNAKFEFEIYVPDYFLLF